MSAEPVQASPMMELCDLPARAEGEMPEPGTTVNSHPQVALTCSLSQGERMEDAPGDESAGGVMVVCEEHQYG